MNLIRPTAVSDDVTVLHTFYNIVTETILSILGTYRCVTIRGANLRDNIYNPGILSIRLLKSGFPGLCLVNNRQS